MSEMIVHTLQEQESIIQASFKRFYYDVGSALRLIRDERLYEPDYSTFAEWCEKNRDRLGFGGLKRVYQLMKSAEVVESLDGLEAPPTWTHAQVLARLPEAERSQVWAKALKSGTTSISSLKSLVAARLPKPQVDSAAKQRVTTTLKQILPAATPEERIEALDSVVRAKDYRGTALLQAVLAKYPEQGRTEATEKKVVAACKAVRAEIREELREKVWWLETNDDRRYRIVSVVADDGYDEVNFDPDQIVRFYKR